MSRMSLITLLMILLLSIGVLAVGEDITRDEIAEEFGIATIYNPVAKENVYISKLSKEELILLLNNHVTQQITFGSDIEWAQQKLEELDLVVEGYTSPSKVVKTLEGTTEPTYEPRKVVAPQQSYFSVSVGGSEATFWKFTSLVLAIMLVVLLVKGYRKGKK